MPPTTPVVAGNPVYVHHFICQPLGSIYVEVSRRELGGTDLGWNEDENDLSYVEVSMKLWDKLIS